jgi:hypothetical protein
MGDDRTAVHPCKHCNGTTFCSATRDATGKLKTRPACVCCLVRAGLNPKGIYDKVICSVCHGTGLVEAAQEPSRRPNPLRWYWLIVTPLLLIALCFFLFGVLSYYREEHKYDDLQDIVRQKGQEASRSTDALPLSAVRKLVRIGMEKAAVRYELGEPEHISGLGLENEIWNYRCKDGRLVITFADDYVSEVR